MDFPLLHSHWRDIRRCGIRYYPEAGALARPVLTARNSMQQNRCTPGQTRCQSPPVPTPLLLFLFERYDEVAVDSAIVVQLDLKVEFNDNMLKCHCDLVGPVLDKTQRVQILLQFFHRCSPVAGDKPLD